MSYERKNRVTPNKVFRLMDRVQEYKYLKAAGALTQNSSEMEILADEANKEIITDEMEEDLLNENIRIQSESN